MNKLDLVPFSQIVRVKHFNIRHALLKQMGFYFDRTSAQLNSYLSQDLHIFPHTRLAVSQPIQFPPRRYMGDRHLRIRQMRVRGSRFSYWDGDWGAKERKWEGCEYEDVLFMACM
jgi:hypothetical protein